ncbi:hypothetical protein RQP46_011154 [Phenoliferia psychrophenolica]
MPSLASTLFTALVAVLLASHVQATTPLISMYWPAYSSAKQPPSAIPWKQASIMNYFVTVTTATGMEIPDGQSTSDLPSFVSLAKSHKVRPVCSVGGWTGSLYFSSLVSTAASRKSFAKDLSSFATKWGFEGIDLDWEYPNHQGIGCNNISSADSANLLLFVKELKHQLGPSKIITAAVSVNGLYGADGTILTDVSEYAKYIDYLNVMNYDVTGTWSGSTGPNSPLNACNSGVGADTTIALWTGAGFPANQLMLSQLSNTTIGNYTSQIYQAMSTTLPKGDSSDNYTTSTDVCGVTTTGYLGHWEMYELISEGLLSSDEKTGKNGFTRHWDDCTSTPFLFNPSTKIFITYDDSESIGLKAEFAVAKGLAGLFIFDSLGFTSKVYSAMKEGLGLTAKSSSSATIKCLTTTTFTLCEGSTCTGTVSVAAGTRCVGGKIVASISAHVGRKGRQ